MNRMTLQTMALIMGPLLVGSVIGGFTPEPWSGFAVAGFAVLWMLTVFTWVRVRDHGR